MVLGKLRRLVLGRKLPVKEKNEGDQRNGDTNTKSKVRKNSGKKKAYEIDRQNQEGEERRKEEAVVENEHAAVEGDDDGDFNLRASVNNDANIDEEEEDSEYCANEESDEDADDAFVGEFVSEEQPKSFSCLSPVEIVAYQEKEIKGLADLLSISPSVSGALLRHFQWKREKLVQRYFENPQQVCKEAGVVYVQTSSPRHHPGRGGSSSSSHSFTMCSICGEDDITPANSSSLSCSHLFCNDCWENYLTTKINGGEPQMHCPQLKCNINVDDNFIKGIVPAAVFEKYLQFVTKNFVQENDRVRWCPTPGCNNAISFDQANSTSDSAIVQCECGYKFCFKCHREAHAPATCDQMKLWEQKCQDDSETFNWKTVNCRECPRCSVAVEKNGGCNHMTCRQCKYEWCWVCMRTWKGHNDFYSCNRFEKEMLAQQRGKRSKSKRKKIEDEKEQKRMALERYLHYYERFVNHDNSRKLEHSGLRTVAAERMREMHDSDSTWAEVQYIERSVDELQDCRGVLKHTYVFAYYFLQEGKTYNNAAAELFQYLQEDLEKTTEQLSEIISETLKAGEIENAQKLSCINQTNLAKTKRENLLHAVARDPLFELVVVV